MKYTISLLCCALLLFLSLSAQVTFGPIVGGNITKYSYVSNPVYRSVAYTYTNNARAYDFRFGLLSNIPLTGRWYLQPSAIYTRNTQKSKASYSWPRLNMASFSINTIQVPVDITYKTRKNKGGRLAFGTGAFLAVNIKGAADARYQIGSGGGSGGIEDYPISIGKIDDSTVPCIKRFGAGIGFNAGYENNDGFFVRLHFQKLLTNLCKWPWYAPLTTYYNYGISLGYQFHKKDKKIAKEERK